MSREAKVAIHASVCGLVIGLMLCIAFGVLDVQCWGSGKPNWNAASQACE